MDQVNRKYLKELDIRHKIRKFARLYLKNELIVVLPGNLWKANKGQKYHFHYWTTCL